MGIIQRDLELVYNLGEVSGMAKLLNGKRDYDSESKEAIKKMTKLIESKINNAYSRGYNDGLDYCIGLKE